MKNTAAQLVHSGTEFTEQMVSLASDEDRRWYLENILEAIEGSENLPAWVRKVRQLLVEAVMPRIKRSQTKQSPDRTLGQYVGYLKGFWHLSLQRCQNQPEDQEARQMEAAFRAVLDAFQGIPPSLAYGS